MNPQRSIDGKSVLMTGLTSASGGHPARALAGLCSEGYKLLLWAGVLAVIFYVAAVVIGGAMRPGYSHIGNFVSELIETGAPNKSWLNPIFAAYNLLTGVFAVGLLIFITTKSPAVPSHLGKIGVIILIAEAIAGLATLFSPRISVAPRQH